MLLEKILLDSHFFPTLGLNWIREKGENNNQTFPCTQYFQDPKCSKASSFDRVTLGIATYKIMCKFGIIGYC